MQDLLEKHWHHLPASEVIDLLDTSGEGGLDQFEVAGRQERFGANALTPAKGKSLCSAFSNSSTRRWCTFWWLRSWSSWLWAVMSMRL